ncbi:hypothetical protein BO82DRAFT_96826 [Aspergillus uvarum CBS 121591]|uniref:Uncharacterized protein n=1 Tax=Aspergillus uvarum CBS 121591 TaxID=1448315 RepID=A0A319C6V4_9EURO|nr:hypothetical protein BO82DRAFT_96826 [Aspergillus uvarum CBS 121591]PYH80944.1 hypothetical protein BO82DRAFT_96826 [Aspergillus uvarum CBS 121591]
MTAFFPSFFARITSFPPHIYDTACGKNRKRKRRGMRQVKANQLIPAECQYHPLQHFQGMLPPIALGPEELFHDVGPLDELITILGPREVEIELVAPQEAGRLALGGAVDEARVVPANHQPAHGYLHQLRLSLPHLLPQLVEVRQRRLPLRVIQNPLDGHPPDGQL